MGRNASNLKPLAPLEDTQSTFLHPFRSQAENTENTSPTAVTAPGALPSAAGGSGATWALETWSCCPGWGRAVFIQIHKHPALLELRFALRTVFPSGSLGSVFQPEPRSRSIPAIVFSFTLAHCFLVWVLLFLFLLF